MFVGNTSIVPSKCLTRFEKSGAAGNLLEEESVLSTFAPEEMFSMIQASYILHMTPACSCSPQKSSNPRLSWDATAFFTAKVATRSLKVFCASYYIFSTLWMLCSLKVLGHGIVHFKNRLPPLLPFLPLFGRHALYGSFWCFTRKSNNGVLWQHWC